MLFQRIPLIITLFMVFTAVFHLWKPVVKPIRTLSPSPSLMITDDTILYAFGPIRPIRPIRPMRGKHFI